MNPIDLRDIISRLFSQPQVLLPELGATIWHHIQQDWWVLIIGTLMFLVLRWWLMRSRRNHHRVRRTEDRRVERRHAKRSLMSAVALWGLWVGYVLFVLAQVGITLSAVTTGILLGGLGVAGALVAQGFFKDLLAGYYVVSEDQYGIGDYVDFGFGFAGVVRSIGMRTTKLRSPDGTVYHIRHSDFSRVGNRTQASGALLMDIELTPYDEHPPTALEVDEWSDNIVAGTVELRRTLRAVREVADDQTPKSATIEAVADVVPTLVPNATEDTLVNLRWTPEEFEVQKAILKAPAGVTPMFHEIEMLGLVDSTIKSATVRLRVRLREQSSRSYAMQLLRRRVFDVMSAKGVAVTFNDVPEGALIN